MKLKFKVLDKVDVDVDDEGLADKALDSHDKNWKERFEKKFEAKKELSKLKHSQKIEMEETKQKKLNFFERRAQERNKLKQMKLEEKIKKERFERIETAVVGIIAALIIIVSIVLGIIYS